MFRTKSILTLASVAALAAGLTGCASGPYYETAYAPMYKVGSVQTTSIEYGRITDMTMVHPGVPTVRVNTTTGTVVGALVGGVVGSTVVTGSGRMPATVLGAAGGAYVGNALSRNIDGEVRGSPEAAVYRVTVTTDRGASIQYEVSSEANLHVGDRVKVENGVVNLS